MNLEIAKNKFIKYTEKYDLSNDNIKRKQLHSLRVMQISLEIAEKLKLDSKEKELACLIGLLHDIGRFEQYTKYGTYNDIKSIDHANLSANIIEKYFDNTNNEKLSNYKDIIIVAIRNHNKYKIEDGLTEKELLFSKIIRDADKIDILFEHTKFFWKNNEQIIENCEISDEIFNNFKKFQTIKNMKNEQPVDNIIRALAFIFDINFQCSFEILKNNNYIDKIIDRYNFKNENTKEKIKEIRKISNLYINKKVIGEL